jgi:hypothetical protein
MVLLRLDDGPAETVRQKICGVLECTEWPLGLPSEHLFNV